MSNKQREAMLNALATLEDVFGKHKIDVGVINQLREALAEPEQEPVAWLVGAQQWVYFERTRAEDGAKFSGELAQPLYTSPQPREWQELDDSTTLRIGVVNSQESGNNRSFSEDQYKSLVKELSAALRAKNGFTV